MIKLPKFLLNDNGKLDGFRLIAICAIVFAGVTGILVAGDMMTLPVDGELDMDQYFVEGTPEVVKLQTSTGGLLMVLGIIWVVLLGINEPAYRIGAMATKGMKRGVLKSVFSLAPALIACSVITWWVYTTSETLSIAWPIGLGILIIGALMLCFIRPWVNKLDNWSRDRRMKVMREGVEYREEQLEKAKDELAELEATPIV